MGSRSVLGHRNVSLSLKPTFLPTMILLSLTSPLLLRWGIESSPLRPLNATAPCRLVLLQAETEVEQFIPPTAAATSFLVTSVISVANAALATSGRALAGSQCRNKYRWLWGPSVASGEGQAGAWS